MKHFYSAKIRTFFLLAVCSCFLFSQANAKEKSAKLQKLPPNSYPFLSGADNIKVNQYLLRSHGQKIIVDGVYGSQTRNAIIRFQRERGLAQTGGVDNATWKALTNKPLKMGSRGDAVRAVQYELKYGDEKLNVVIDGVFGSQTEAAVIRNQRFLQNVPAGVVEFETWRALLGSTTPAYP